MQPTTDSREKRPTADSEQRWRTPEEISVVVVNYNGIATVLDTIGSVLGMEGVRPHVVVVDDGSIDGSIEEIFRRFPEVEVHREPRNTREVNRLRNLGLARARTDKVFVTDNDVIFDKRCFLEMLRAMEADELVAMCIPRLMYSDEPSTVYMAGGKVHYVGATIQPSRDAVYDERREPEPAVGGGIALFDRRKLARVGAFDEAYELAWGDDVELHQRLLLAGYKSLYVPTAVGYHEHKPFGKSRHYRARGQVRNRWRFIVTHYSLRTLLLATPALLCYEAVQAAFFAAKGIPLLYVCGTLDALRSLPATLRRRRDVQALRVAADRDILFAGKIYLRPEHGAGGRAVRRAVSAASVALGMYWKVIRPALGGDHRPAAARLSPKAQEVVLEPPPPSEKNGMAARRRRTIRPSAKG